MTITEWVPCEENFLLLKVQREWSSSFHFNTFSFVPNGLKEDLSSLERGQYKVADDVIQRESIYQGFTL